MQTTRRRRSVVVVCVLVALLVGAAGAAAAAYDRARHDRLAPGVEIGGVDVGGTRLAVARQRLERLVVEPRRRTLRVHAAGRTFRLPADRIHLTVDVDAALGKAMADSRRGWLGTRFVNELTGHRLDERLPLVSHYATASVTHLVARVAAKTDRRAVDARVRPAATGLQETPSQSGRAVNRAALRRALARAVRDPSRPADVTATTRPVAAKMTTGELHARYPAYIVIDRAAHKLRFYEHLRLSRTYDIAVGRAGLETPAGLYDVQWKQVNPPWYVPNSAWAGALAGKTIPPGPRDPIKARWLAFNGGAGIHGIDPSEYGSIGHDASHGCVRMRIPDVIELYGKTPVHSPVYVA